MHAVDLQLDHHTLVLSALTWDRNLCNDLFNIDNRMQSLRSPMSGSALVNAMNMVNRKTDKWRTLAKPFYLNERHTENELVLYIPLGDFYSAEKNANPPAIRHLMSKTGMQASQAAPPAALLPPLPSASAIPVSTPGDAAMTAQEVSNKKLRAAAKAMVDENRKSVLYDDGRPVPADQWQATFPLFALDPQTQQVKPLLTDLLQQTRAHKVMNQRPVSDAMVDKLFQSIIDTPQFVKLPEKIGVLLSPTVYSRLNDYKYRGDLFAGLTEDELAFPDDPVQAVLDGERILIIIAGNHGTVAQLKVVKQYIEQNR